MAESVNGFGGVTPIFVFSKDGDVLSFDTAASAEAYLEAVDVRDGEYPIALDARGKPLRLLIRSESLWPRWLLGTVEHVEVVVDTDQPSRGGELAVLLRGYLNPTGGDECAVGLPLSEIVSLAHARSRCG
jgi:hypothetical protein